MTYSAETQAVQQKARDTEVWFTFFLDPNFRRFNCVANRVALDDYLTRNGFELSIETLTTAVAALGTKLAVLDATQHAKRKAALASTVVEPTPATVDDGSIPVEIDRKAIIKMGKDEYKALQKKYGNAAIEARANQIEEVKQ
jgi:hypothetical protein